MSMKTSADNESQKEIEFGGEDFGVLWYQSNSQSLEIS